MTGYNIVEVVTSTCSVCKMLKPMIEKVVSTSGCNLLVQYADSDAVEERVSDLIEEYNIRSVPAFFFMHNDTVVSKHFGSIAMPELKAKIEELKNYGC